MLPVTGEPTDKPGALTWTAVGPEGGVVFDLKYMGGSMLVAFALPHIWLSTDMGATWAVSGRFFNFDLEDATSTANGNLVAFNSGYGCVYSTDYGAGWAVSTGGPSAADDSRFADEVNGIVYLLALSGDTATPYYSTDDGVNFTQGAPGTGVQALGAVASATSSPQVAYASTVSDSIYFTVTTDTGVSWVTVSTFDTTGLGVVYDLAVDYADPANVYTSINRSNVPPLSYTLWSTDSGATWSVIDSNTCVQDIFVIDSFSLLCASANPEGLFYYSYNGSTWNGVQLYADEGGTVTAFAGNLFLATAGVGVVTSTNGGTTWNETNSSLRNVWAFTPSGISAIDSVVYLFDSFSGRLYKSVDDGNSWTRLAFNPIFDPGSPSALSGPSMAAVSTNDLFLSTLDAADLTTFASSTDGGATWARVNIFSAPVSTYLAPKSTATVFAYGVNYFTGQTGVFRTANGGGLWGLVRSYPVGWMDGRTLAVDGAGDLFFNDTSGLVRSTDDGTTWAPFANPFTTPVSMDTTTGGLYVSVTTAGSEGVWGYTGTWNQLLALGAAYSSQIFYPDVAVATDQRLATAYTDTLFNTVIPYSVDLGGAWNQDTITSVLPSNVTLARNTLILGTIGDGLFVAPLVGVGVSEASPAPIVASVSVFGVLSLTAPAGTHVSVTVYDAAGRLVNRAFDAPLEGGALRLDLARGTHSVGVYLVRVSAGKALTRTFKFVEAR